MARAAPLTHSDASARFESLYQACYEDLLRYALRRADRPDMAADVVAETFLVAWQRIGEIPLEQGRAWLFGVARNVLANQRRAARRGSDLVARLRNELSHVTAVEPAVPSGISAAFRHLPEADQELLRLVAWEGLGTDELATALGCSTNAARIRLHRARRRFTEALQAAPLTT